MLATCNFSVGNALVTNVVDIENSSDRSIEFLCIFFKVLDFHSSHSNQFL